MAAIGKSKEEKYIERYPVFNRTIQGEAKTRPREKWLKELEDMSLEECGYELKVVEQTFEGLRERIEDMIPGHKVLPDEKHLKNANLK